MCSIETHFLSYKPHCIKKPAQCFHHRAGFIAFNKHNGYFTRRYTLS